MNKTFWGSLLTVALLAAPVLATAETEEEGERAQAGDRRCLSINRIRSIDIVDDYTLYFHMRGGEYDYVNRLPHRCGGLKSHGTFMHSTSTNNYCDLDMITVLDTNIGMRLGSCPLGRFEAVERGVGPRNIEGHTPE